MFPVRKGGSVLPGDIRSFAERHGADYLLLRASRDWARRHFDLFGMPLTLIVDAEGRIRERLVGPQTEERLRELLEPVLAVPPIGRRTRP